MDILSGVDDPDQRAELFALAGDYPDWAVRRIRERGEEAVPALVAALREDSLGGVAYGRMLGLLVEIDPAQAYGPATAGLADSRSQVQWAARSALGAIPGRQAAEALVRLLSDPSEDVVVHVASILGRRRESTAVRPLANLLTSSDTLIRYSAARALGQIGNAEARRALLNHVRHEDDNDTRELIAETLATM
jgi:HEAT repeat protein